MVNSYPPSEVRFSTSQSNKQECVIWGTFVNIARVIDQQMGRSVRIFPP